MFNLEQMQQLSALKNKLESEARAKKAAEIAEQRAKEAAKPKIKPIATKRPLIGKLDERFIADRVEVEGKQYVVLNLDADSGPWRATTPQQVSAYHAERYSGQYKTITQGFRH